MKSAIIAAAALLAATTGAAFAENASSSPGGNMTNSTVQTRDMSKSPSTGPSAPMSATGCQNTLLGPAPIQNSTGDKSSSGKIETDRSANNRGTTNRAVDNAQTC